MSDAPSTTIRWKLARVGLQTRPSAGYSQGVSESNQLILRTYGSTQEEAVKRANLASAAPDLLEACKTLADYFAGHDPQDIPSECGSGVRDALVLARAAISKAEGGVK